MNLKNIIQELILKKELILLIFNRLGVDYTVNDRGQYIILQTIKYPLFRLIQNLPVYIKLVKGDIFLDFENISSFGEVKFGIVDGRLKCMYCNLHSLKGCPAVSYGSYDISNNKLTSLLYGPIRVMWSFDCGMNLLKSLEYAPDYVGKDY